MANKTQGETLINTLIDNGLNKALKVRNIFKYLHDIFFSEVITENSTSLPANPIFGNLIAGYSYEITYSKKGNAVHLNGIIRNNSGTATGLSLFNIANSEFFVRSSNPAPVFSATKINNTVSPTISTPVHLRISPVDGFMLVNGNIAVSEYVVFNGTYFVNDN